jgi:hypothetical protein
LNASLERQAAAIQPLQAQTDHRVFGNGRVDACPLFGIELVIQVTTSCSSESFAFIGVLRWKGSAQIATAGIRRVSPGPLRRS